MNRMTEAARALRAATPYAPDVPRELNKGVTPPYIVEPGDVLLVQAVDPGSTVRLPGDQKVLPDGTIQLGQYGRPMVAGKTVLEIEGLVKALVEVQTRDAGPISVRLITSASKVFYVLGEVNSPGAFPFTGRETVLDAILTAGGLTPRAARQRIILTRPTPPNGCRMVLPVCYDDLVQEGDTSTSYQVSPGDRIFVPSQTCWEQLGCKKSCPPCHPPQTACPLPGPAGPPHP
jgi:protein involved in polysaccharide export with SLBB domain